MRRSWLTCIAACVFLTGCSSPAKDALNACDAWNRAIGASTPEIAKSQMDLAVTLATSAANSDGRWADLARGLADERRGMSAVGYSTPNTSGYFSEIEPSCQTAGQPP